MLFLQELRDKVTKAVQSVAVFATEWGTCDADGDGTLNFQEAKIWFPGWLGWLSCRVAFGSFGASERNDPVGPSRTQSKSKLSERR